MAVGYPIVAEQVKGGLGERHVAIFGTLSTVDMDHHAGGVDIGDFEMESFVKPQAAGVYGGKIGIVLEGLDSGQKASDFFHAENGRKSSFILGAEDSEDVPVALEDVLVEEAYAAIADPHGIGRPLISVLPLEEIVLKLLLANEIGRLAVELDEHAQGPCIGLLRAFPFAVELKGLDHSVIPLSLHDTSPFSLRMNFPFPMRRGCEVSYSTVRDMARRMCFWGEFSGGITKKGICRVAAYLNHSFQPTALQRRLNSSVSFEKINGKGSQIFTT
jgi:hypothetical protein